MRVLIILLVCLVCFGIPNTYCQDQQNNLPSNSDPSGTQVDTAIDLIRGTRIEGKDLIISQEGHRLLIDSVYRKEAYPDAYNFEQVADLLEKGEVLQSLWWLINLYDKSPAFTLSVVKDLSGTWIEPKHYTQAFYTYVFTDPELMDFGSTEPQLMNPELLKRKTAVCKFLADYSQKISAHNLTLQAKE